jgi:hypothetical protein
MIVSLCGSQLVYLFLLGCVQPPPDGHQRRAQICRQGNEKIGSRIEKGCTSSANFRFRILCKTTQAQTAFNSLTTKMNELASTINTAEDGIFANFCQEINVSNIREYEERQLKVAQEESESRLHYDTQIARFTNQ